MPNTPTSPFFSPRSLYCHSTDVLEVFDYELPSDRSGIYGVELELDWRHKDEAWEAIKNSFDQLPCFIAKYDGSICGPEIVSLPMTKEEHQTYIETLQDSGALGHLQATSRDGIHVHIDKTTMSADEQLCLGILVYSRPMQELLDVFCRRRANSFCRRGPRYHPTISNTTDPDRVVQLASNIISHEDRYDAVNFGAETTIEFRMFKSSTSTAAYMRTIEVVELLRSYAKQLNEIQSPTPDVAAVAECTPEKLIAYLLANSSKFPGLRRWVRTSRRFSPWFIRTAATPAQESERTRDGYLRNRLMGRTQTPTHGEVANAVATMTSEEYVVWYAEQCGGRFVSARGHVREGAALRWQSRYHARLIARRTRRQAPLLPADTADRAYRSISIPSEPLLTYEYA